MQGVKALDLIIQRHFPQIAIIFLCKLLNLLNVELSEGRKQVCLFKEVEECDLFLRSRMLNYRLKEPLGEEGGIHSVR